jgi:hypothetical protein
MLIGKDARFLLENLTGTKILWMASSFPDIITGKNIKLYRGFTVKGKIAKAVRVVTIAPISAFVLLIILYISRPAVFGGLVHFVSAVVFLVLLPILAYPLQPLVPGFKDQGRKGQRTLAMLMANLGYILGIIFVIFVPSPGGYLLIYLTYFLSGLLFLLCNRAFKIKASGHACGIAGPIAALTYFVGAKALWGLIVLGAAYWASLAMKRHTKLELVIGTLISVMALFVSLLISRPI